MNQPRTNQPVDLALCLSGGGYRAALFHLGSMWRLHELGLLRVLGRISGVSGGSIAAAWLATRIMRDRAGNSPDAYAAWSDQLDVRFDLVEPFFAVAERDIRTLPALWTLLPNLLWHRFGAGHLERSYRRLITAAPLHALPQTPDFVFCATDLTFGVNFEFGRRRVGDYQCGYLRGGSPDVQQMPIARAIAASSCFPPVFGPLRLRWPGARFVHGRYRGDDRDALLARIDLTDGGVYDNLGTEPVLKHAATILISDAGAPFPFRAGGYSLRRLLRYTSVIGNQALALRRRLFRQMRRSGQLDGALWRLAAVEDAGAFGYSSGFVHEVIAPMRTDLDHFTRSECEVLVNHGYASCEAALDAQGIARDPAARIASFPYPDAANESLARRALRHSARRFAPARMLAGWFSSQRRR